MRVCNFALLCIVLIGACGCVTASVDLANPSKSYKPTKYVQFLIEKPSRPYKVIAIINGDGSPNRKQSLVFKKVEKKAREIGAQAIVPLNSSLTYFPSSNLDGPKLMPSDKPEVGRIGDSGNYDFNLKVAAIRFTETEDELQINKAQNNEE